VSRVKIAILGATGMVGREMLAILIERGFVPSDIRLLASARSAGREVAQAGHVWTVEATTPEAFDGVDLVLASAGGDVSRKWAPIAVSRGATVIDNTSAFRLDPSVPLVIPEINAHALEDHRGIIANPNCSTAILLMVLHPLRRLATIKRVVVSTYQSVSGAGREAVEELRAQSRQVLDGERPSVQVLSAPIAFNLIPTIDAMTDQGYTREELKFTHETRKIFEEPLFMISGTCIRVPVEVGHSESVNIEFDRVLDLEVVRATLAQAPGVRVVDDRKALQFPQPLEAAGLDDVLVGRLRADISHPHAIQCWVVGDNLRRGAALNAVLIAEMLRDRGWIKGQRQAATSTMDA